MTYNNKTATGFILLTVLLNSALMAQKIDYNTIILPKSAANIDLSEKLVRLAWENNPENEILNRQVNIANYEIKQAKSQWLNHIGFSGNLNEFNIDPTRDVNQRSQFFPRYNIGASIKLGDFVNNPVNVKIKKEEMRMTIETINSRKLNLRAEVLRRYETYLKEKELLRLQIQATEDMLATFNLVEQRFRNGEATLEEYNSAQNIYNGEIASKVTAQSSFNISKINLEELIGVRLEDVQ